MAPNSLIALAQHIMDPTAMLRRAKGRVITKNVLRDPEPSVRATFSMRGSILSNPSLAEFTTKEELTKSIAITTPGRASVKMIPNLLNGTPSIPPDVKTSKRAIPLTVWGITTGISIIDSTSPFPKKSCLARIYASGTPNRRAIIVAASAEYTLTNMDLITSLS